MLNLFKMKVLQCFDPLCFATEHTQHPTAPLHTPGNHAESGIEAQLLAGFIIQIAFLVSLLSSTPAAAILPALPPHTFPSVQLPIQSAGVLEEMMGKQENKVQ